MQHAHISSGGRYPILRSVAILWMVAALLALLGGVYQAIVTLFGVHGQQWLAVGTTTNTTGRLIGFFIWLAMTFFAVLFNVAVAEAIKLFIDIEQNTRFVAMNAPPAGAMPSDGNRARYGEETAEGALLRGH